MDDFLLVDVLHTFQDLPHVACTSELRVLKVLVHQPFEKLSACDAEQTGQDFSVRVTEPGISPSASLTTPKPSPSADARRRRPSTAPVLGDEGSS